MATKNGNGQIKIKQFKFNLNVRTIFIILFIFLFLFFGYQSVKNEVQKALPEKSITTIIKEAKDGKIKKVEIIDNKIIVYYKDEKLSLSYKESTESFTEILKNNNVNPSAIQINVKDTQGSTGLVAFLSNLLPTILMVAFFVFLFRQAKGAQDSVFSFGQSRAKRFSKDMPQTTFADVAGVDEAKHELEEVVDFLKHPEKYGIEGLKTWYLTLSFYQKFC